MVHYQNVDTPERCLIRLYKFYMSVCPKNRPDDAFYLKLLVCPKGDCGFSTVPIGHNMLQKMVPNLFKSAGIAGYYTNHSLKATTATRLFEAGVDEQLIMQRTRHSNTAVRSYKRIGEKLRPLTSDVLNNTVSGTNNNVLDDVDRKNTIQKMKNDGGSKGEENKMPNMTFTGSSNFTININYK